MPKLHHMIIFETNQKKGRGECMVFLCLLEPAVTHKTQTLTTRYASLSTLKHEIISGLVNCPQKSWWDPQS